MGGRKIAFQEFHFKSPSILKVPSTYLIWGQGVVEGEGKIQNNLKYPRPSFRKYYGGEIVGFWIYWQSNSLHENYIK